MKRSGAGSQRRVLGLLLLSAALPVLAQHGAGHGGGGAAAGHAGGAVSARSFAGPRAAAVAPAASNGYSGIRISSFGTQTIGGVPAARSTRGRGERGRYGYGGVVAAGVPYGYGFVSPYVLGYPEEIGAGDAGVADSQALSAYGPQAPAGYGMQSAEPGYGAGYASQPEPGYAEQREAGPPPPVRDEAPSVAAQAAPARTAAAVPDADAVTVVFKDGRPSEQIRNYMLTRTTLYVTDKKRREIPIDEIDIPATDKANRSAGVSFQLPAK